MNPLPVVTVREGTRWDCHRCGECCKGWRVSLYPADIEKLEQVDWASIHPRFRDGFWAAAYDELSGETEPRLRHVGERCIFLDADNLCLIHKQLGHAQKPLVCRSFPYRFARLPDGRIEVAVTSECLTHHESFEKGTLVAPDEELARLAAEVPAGDLAPFEHIYLSRPDVVLSWKEYQALLDELLPGPDAALAALPARVSRAVRARIPSPPPPRASHVPPEMAWVRTLEVLKNLLAANGPKGSSFFIAGMDALREFGAWKRVEKEIAPKAQRFLVQVFRGFVAEARPLTGYRDATAGLGACLYATMASALGAVRLATHARHGMADGADANEVAKEGSLFFRSAPFRKVLSKCAAPFARLVLECPL